MHIIITRLQLIVDVKPILTQKKYLLKLNLALFSPLERRLQCAVWQYGLWSFQMGYTKLERFLHKNQHTQRKLLNFEFWIIQAALSI